MLLLPDILQLLLGEVATINYPFVKNCLQAATAWEMEQAGSIVFQREHVVSGAARPCPLGQAFEDMLGRPEPQTFQWFMLRLDPPGMLVTEFFNRRLVEQGVLELKVSSQWIFFKKNLYPRLPAGEVLAKEWQAKLQPAVAAIHGQQLQTADYEPRVLMSAVFLDAFKLLPRQSSVDISKQSLQALIAAGLTTLYGSKAIYQYASNVSGLGSLVNFGLDFFDLDDPLNG